MKAISLFAGAGGMDVGFTRAGFDVVAANELDTYACATFRENHPRTELIEGDIKEHLDRLASFRNIDAVFGGPPCQGFSVAGKMEPNDPRSELIFSFAEIVGRVKPRLFVMENVKALGSLAKFSKIRSQLVSQFSQAGYSVQIHSLNAKDFGVPQSRERVFFIGVLEATYKNFLPSLLRQKKVAPSLRAAIIPLGKPGSPRNSRVCNAKVTLAAKPVLRKSPYAGMLFNGQGRPLNPDGWASTLPASMGGNRTPIVDEHHLYEYETSWVESYHSYLINGGKPYRLNDVPSYLRRLTIDETALLQGFPEDYKFCGPNSKVYSQIGNAVPCELAYVVAKVAADYLFGELVEVSENESLQLSLC